MAEDSGLLRLRMGTSSVEDLIRAVCGRDLIRLPIGSHLPHRGRSFLLRKKSLSYSVEILQMHIA